MREKPRRPIDVGLPLQNDSQLSCNPCFDQNASAVGKIKKTKGLFDPSDFEKWTRVDRSEFVLKMLVLAERPSLDTTGFLPAHEYDCNRPVKIEDVLSGKALWRAEWANLESTRGGKPIMPLDWREQNLSVMPSVAVLDELWEMARTSALQRSSVTATLVSRYNNGIGPTLDGDKEVTSPECDSDYKNDNPRHENSKEAEPNIIYDRAAAGNERPASAALPLAGRTDKVASQDAPRSSRPATRPATGYQRYMLLKAARTLNIPVPMIETGAPLKVQCNAGAFFFPNHGELCATILKLSHVSHFG